MYVPALTLGEATDGVTFIQCNDHRLKAHFCKTKELNVQSDKKNMDAAANQTLNTQFDLNLKMNS